jgi:DNA-binding response OmpR family regulator
MNEILATSVLILNEDKFARAEIADFLRANGLTVIEAACGPEADYKISAGDPGVVIVDYKQPQGDGLHWISKVREAGRVFPIIFLSGSLCDLNSFNRLRYILRVSLILGKPIDPSQLIDGIKTLLPAQALNSRTNESYSAIAPGANIIVGEVLIEEQTQNGRQPSLAELQLSLNEMESQEMRVAVRNENGNNLLNSWRQLGQALYATFRDQKSSIMRQAASKLANEIGAKAISLEFPMIARFAEKIEDLLDPSCTIHSSKWLNIFRALEDGDMFLRGLIEGLNVPAQGSYCGVPSLRLKTVSTPGLRDGEHLSSSAVIDFGKLSQTHNSQGAYA